MLEHRRRQITDIDFVKKCKQRAMTLKSDTRKLPRTTNHAAGPPSRSAMWVVVRRRGLQRTPWRQVSDATVVTWNWSSHYFRVVDGMAALCRRLFRVFLVANDRRWGNYRRSALFVQRRAPCWRMCVRVTVAVNGVCAGQQCTCETCTISYSDSLGPSAPLSGYIISTANAVLQHTYEATNRQRE